jgi:hypothetical protein
MIPHERSLVKKLADKPFALIGVNSDKDRDALKQRLAKEQMSWRHFWDGSDGPITKAWHVRAEPMIYAIDAEGVIRFKDVGDAEVEAAIDFLLAEMAAKAAKTKGK